MWEGGYSPLPQGRDCWILSPVHTHTHTPLRLWSLSPGAQEFSDLRAARLGIRARVRPRESRVALLSPPRVAGGPGLSAGRCSVGCSRDWSGWLWAGGWSPVLWWVEDGVHPIHHLAATGLRADTAIKAQDRVLNLFQTVTPQPCPCPRPNSSQNPGLGAAAGGRTGL